MGSSREIRTARAPALWTVPCEERWPANLRENVEA